MMNFLGLYAACFLMFVNFCPNVIASKPESNKARGETDQRKQPENDKPVISLPKEIIVIGGGISGLAAARTLTGDRSHFNVKVFEAQRDRYGGRVWTDKLTNMKARGLEVDLGAIALNVRAKHNPLLELVESFELETASLGDPQFIVPWEGKAFSGDEFSNIKKEALEILHQALNESRSWKLETSVKEAVDAVLERQAHDQFRADVEMLKALPSYVAGDYSTMNYRPEQRDAGYEKVLLDGMGELVDRLLSGSSEEPPLHMYLNKAVRQIQVDRERNKVMVRTTDGLQTLVDGVVVAVPAHVIAAQSIIFEPPLPKQYMLAAQEVGASAGNRVIVEFERSFWPSEFGVFIRAVRTEEERGHLQSWINVHRLIKKPVLSGSLSGASAISFEKLTDEEAKESVLAALTDMFGEEVVQMGGKIVRMQRSKWMSDPLFGGTGSYPKVGASPDLWNVFREPLCPFIYFAGEHTDSESPGSLHGAYNSGVRAGNQITSRLCEVRMEEERVRKEQERKKREQKLKNQTKEGSDGNGRQVEDENVSTSHAEKEEL